MLIIFSSFAISSSSSSNSGSNTHIADGYCPFYYDKVSCWNATPPNTKVRIKCVTWQFDRPNPAGYVELKCENGHWQNITGDDLVNMYKPCLMADFIVKYGRLIAQSGYIISMLSLLLAITIFLYLKKFRCGRNQVHLNLFVSHLLRYIFSTIQYFYSYHNNVETDMNLTLCRTVTTIWNYFLLCSYFWIFVEGLYLHNVIYVSIFREPRVWPFALLGWGAPLLITCFWAVTKVANDPSRCWLSLNYHLILRIPLFIIIIAEVLMAVNIARQLYYKLQNEAQSHERMRYKIIAEYVRKLARATLLLIGGTGVNFFIFDFVVAVTGIVSRGAEIAHTIYVIVNSLWGTVVAFLYCFTSEEIHTDWKLKEAHRKLHQAIKREFENSRIYYAKKGGSRKASGFCTCNNKLEVCEKCEFRKKFLKKTGFLKSSGSSAVTLCSTAVNSNQNTICAKTTPYPPRVSHLSFCREESEDISAV
uniref:G_PROTEIN_RECEP_F2_4 domain-containing protein n=1 Tax=Syphacia muris TaxID=451379 RepID=A0A0N5A9A9_9BILA